MKNLLLTLSLLFTAMACKDSTTKQQNQADIKQQDSLSTSKTESDLEMEIPKKGTEIKVYGVPAKIGIGEKVFLSTLKYNENEKTFHFNPTAHPSQI
jgi:hypothetical protein